MGPLDQLNHLLNFLAPAVAVGVVLALCGPFVMGKKLTGAGIVLHSLLNCGVGALVLVAGLWFFGHDGKMATYAAMLLACVLSQGLLRQR